MTVRTPARLLLAAATVACLTGPTTARRPPQTADPFDLIELGPGVLAAVLRNDVPSYAFANSLLVVGDEGVLIVDTQQDPAAARTLLDAVRSRTSLPVRWVVNTHEHADHVWGNEVYRAAFPDVSIVAHRTTRAFLLEHGEAEIEKQRTSVRESIAVRREWLARGTGPEGAPLTDADRQSLGRSLELRAAYLGELDTLQLIVPNVTFDDAMSVDLGGRSVELIHVGPAHTAGDIVAYLPESGVLAAGDVVEEGRLWLEGADVRGWARALSRLRKLDVSSLLPGHGGVSRGQGLLDVEGGFLDAAVAWADHEAREGDLDPTNRGREPCSSEAPIPAAISAYADSFSAWGVEPEAFRELALQACRGALPPSRADRS